MSEIEYATITKAMLWEVMGDKAIPFAVWLADTTNSNAVAIDKMLQTIDDINLKSPLVQMSLLPLLQAEGILEQADVDRINALADEKANPTF